jgi:hypothetical protein
MANFYRWPQQLIVEQKQRQILLQGRNHLGIEFKLAAAGFACRIVLFLFFTKFNFCAEALRALQIDDKFLYLAPMSA